MGFAVVQGDEMLLEHYASDHGRTRWITFSVTKSVNSMLVGAAIEDGYITNIDDKVTDYLPRLKGSEYEAVTIEQILQMSSGVAWDEDYTNPESDVSVAGAANSIT